MPDEGLPYDATTPAAWPKAVDDWPWQKVGEKKRKKVGSALAAII